MNAIQAVLDSPLMHCLGWVLVHFLWQGLVVGALYLGMRQLLRGQSSAVRYNLAMGTLAVMAVLPVVTFVYLVNTTVNAGTEAALHSLAGVATVSVHPGPAASLSPFDHLRLWLQPLIPWAVPAWLLGVLIMTLRVWRGWRRADQLRETATYMPLSEWHAVIESLRSLLGINRLVRLAVSSRVVVPSVVGWLKPMILIPPSVLAGLTPQQMELILAHELAHIRRQDYLWNLLQVSVETLLFYHPVVRWVSHQARLEREQCCDDMVVELRGNKLEYARALTELESLRHPRSALLLGASGGQVLDRVQRLLGLPTSTAPAFWLPLLLAAGLLFATGIMHFARHTLPVQPVLTGQYTLFGEHAPGPPASLESAAASLAPTRIATHTGIHAASLQPLPVAHGPLMPALTPLSGLTAPAQAAATASAVRPAPALDKTPAPRRMNGIAISRTAPTYPAIALERGTEGSVRLQFTLTPAGEVTDIRVLRVTGSRLFVQAATDAILEWKFKPASVAGIPVAQRMTEEFVFRLDSGDANSGACKIPMGYHVCNPNST